MRNAGTVGSVGFLGGVSMKSMQRRLMSLERSAGQGSPKMPSCIVISLVAPGPNGPVNMGPHTAHILKGPNAGLQLSREETESAEAFQERCDAMVVGKQ
jgi:hypothetical protein